MESIPFQLRDEYIELYKLLKVTGVCESGGGAGALIASGSVKVDGKVELRKGAKIRAGQVVETSGARIPVQAKQR